MKYSCKKGPKTAARRRIIILGMNLFMSSRARSRSALTGSETTALPGTLVHLPAGTTHWFRFGKGGGEMISMTSREGASRMFTEIDREISPDNPDLGKLVEIGQRHGLAVIAPTK